MKKIKNIYKASLRKGRESNPKTRLRNVTLLLVAGVAVTTQLGWRAGTPEPILDENPEFIQLYWKAWENLQSWVFEEQSPGPFPNRFIAPRKRIGFDETISTALYSRWAWRANPIAETLEFALSLTDANGEAPTWVQIESGSREGQAKGPPLTGLALWRLYEISGNADHLRTMFANALRRSSFLRAKYSVFPADAEPPTEDPRRTKLPKPLRFVPPGWSDVPDHDPSGLTLSAEAVGLCLQDAFFLRRCAIELRLRDSEQALSALINSDSKDWESLWNPDLGSYIGIDASKTPIERASLPALWGLMGSQSPQNRSKRALSGLFDSALFGTPVFWPTVPKPDASYRRDRGVYALHQYLTLRCLLESGERSGAGLAAERMLRSMGRVAGSELLLFNAYGPETREPDPGSQKDSVDAGLIAIGALIEAVLGFEVRASEREVIWDLYRTDRHGLLRLRFADNVVSLIASARNAGKPPVVEVECEKPFKLRLKLGPREWIRNFESGKHTWKVH
jgi:hypothetical protein